MLFTPKKYPAKNKYKPNKMPKFFKITNIALLLNLLIPIVALAQNNTNNNPNAIALSGSIHNQTQFFLPDSNKQIYGTPFYDYLFYANDTWLTLQAQLPQPQLQARIRLQAHQQTNLFNPTKPVTQQGIGLFWLQKSFLDNQKLNLEIGHLYFQVGNGTALRTYENRNLGIDNALQGIKINYKLLKNIQIQAFSGQIKNNILSTYQPIVKGIDIETFNVLHKKSKTTLYTTFLVMNRTLNAQTMQLITNEINNYTPQQRFIPTYNTWVFNAYNKLKINSFLEYNIDIAIKTPDILRSPQNQLFKADKGKMILNQIAFMQKKWYIQLAHRYLHQFECRTSPNEQGLYGNINYIPTLQTPFYYRLSNLYVPTPQVLGEQAWLVKANTQINKFWNLNAEYAAAKNTNNTWLYANYTLALQYQADTLPYNYSFGVQLYDYNQQIFEQKNDWINAFLPFAKFLYNPNPYNTFKAETQFLFTNRQLLAIQGTTNFANTPQDRGNWAWLLTEWQHSPSISIAAGSLYNFKNKWWYPYLSVTAQLKKYGVLQATFSQQPAGVVCTGGVCRFEPAFSGAKIKWTNHF